MYRGQICNLGLWFGIPQNHLGMSLRMPCKVCLLQGYVGNPMVTFVGTEPTSPYNCDATVTKVNSTSFQGLRSLKAHVLHPKIIPNKKNALSRSNQYSKLKKKKSTRFCLRNPSKQNDDFNIKIVKNPFSKNLILGKIHGVLATFPGWVAGNCQVWKLSAMHVHPNFFQGVHPRKLTAGYPKTIILGVYVRFRGCSC